MVAVQTETDRVMRERKKLLVDTAAHLLQVTATVRREIPERSKQVKEMFDGVRISETTELQRGKLVAARDYLLSLSEQITNG